MKVIHNMHSLLILSLFFLKNVFKTCLYVFIITLETILVCLQNRFKTNVNSHYENIYEQVKSQGFK